ncbi:hypothetical protein SAMD00019534_097050, partial [Acytostelium subglobosum LB1]|uniref:hypothetical protein n=1 Tax=Acytostelium subglobosum LB1 TaxID=1410327 RepID=UPI000644C2AB
MVTAKGRPSGTATTMIVMAPITMVVTSLAASFGMSLLSTLISMKYLGMMMSNNRTAAVIPNFPMLPARWASFFWSGVSSDSTRRDIMVLPLKELTPTAVTIILPKPSRTWLPEMKNGSWPSLPFLIGLDSPVMDDSSQEIEWPST